MKKDDVKILKFPNTTSNLERQVEAILFAADEPLDEESILKTVQKTNRGLVVHEDKVFAGFGGEIVALINEKAFDFLDAPVLRVGSTFTPVGFNRILERATLPNKQRIMEKALELLNY